MRRISFIAFFVLVALLAAAGIYRLTVTRSDGGKIVIPTNKIDKIEFSESDSPESVPLETPVVQLQYINDDDILFSWEKVNSAIGYAWCIDDGKSTFTSANAISLGHFSQQKHNIYVRALAYGDKFMDSDEAFVEFEPRPKEEVNLSEVFADKESSLKYLEALYKYLPYEAEYQGSNSYEYGGDASVGTAMSDEALFSWYQWVTYLNFRTADWSPTTFGFNNWDFLYTGIEKAATFIDNIGICPDFNEGEKRQMVAQARLIRAYCYFQLFRRYGPVYIDEWLKKGSYINYEEIDRDTVDENVDYMIAEIDKAIEDLPLDVDDPQIFVGSITKGAAMALKSRLTLYAASTLYNGGYSRQLKNKDGDNLFPAYDDEKWERAAKAAKDVIDLGKYSLIVKTGCGDAMADAIASYQAVQFEPFNNEAIWGYWPRMGAATYNIPCFNRQRMLPPRLAKASSGAYCASMKLFDSYPMQKTGRFPINPFLKRNYDGLHPDIDSKSGYSIDGFVLNWEHPIEGKKFGIIKAHKSCVDRDARFYASIMANGFKFISDFIVGGNREVTFYTGGTSSFNPNDCVKSGFLWRRFLPADLDYDNGEYGQYFYWYFRLAEIYLNYAEACNEKPNRDASEALKYLNLVRARVGLNKIEEAYPEYDFMTNRIALREMIRQERMVELAFEGHRYYDVRRWMTAVKELTGPNYTLDLMATNYDSSWNRTTRVWQGADNRFEQKHYLFPIFKAQTERYRNMTQNSGW